MEHLRNAARRGAPCRRIGLLAAAALALLGPGCTGQFALNLAEERAGNVTVLVVNNTPFRASFTFGSWDSLDRNPPGPVAVLQSRLEANTSLAPATVTCRRNLAIGTQEYVDRVIDTDSDSVANFDPDAFGVNVNFSSAPEDSDAAALPTEGTARGREVRLGVDYTCGDQLIFTLEQDDAAPGGFRIDFTVLPDEESDR